MVSRGFESHQRQNFGGSGVFLAGPTAERHRGPQRFKRGRGACAPLFSLARGLSPTNISAGAHWPLRNRAAAEKSPGALRCAVSFLGGGPSVSEALAPPYFAFRAGCRLPTFGPGPTWRGGPTSGPKPDLANTHETGRTRAAAHWAPSLLRRRKSQKSGKRNLGNKGACS